jgi:hypothetical protein
VSLSARREALRIGQGLSELEPEALYVFKLGPMRTHEGRCHVYLPVQGNGASCEPVVATSDAQGLAALAPLFEGRRLYCEQRLARAGATYGFVPRVLPQELLHVRALMALSTQWGPLSRETSPELLVQFLEVAESLWRVHPWELWTNIEVFELRLEGVDPCWREGCLLGNGGEELGFALYREPGTVERLGVLTEEERLQQALQMESLAINFEEEPTWVRSAVRQATGLSLFPIALRLSGGGFAPVNREDLMVLIAVARALTQLSPERLEPRGEVSWGGLQVTAHVRAHLPLFTAQRSAPPALPRCAGLVVPEAERPPEMSERARRRFAETLITFIQPFLPESIEEDPDLMMMLLELGATTWNAAVLDTWEPGPRRVEAARDAVRALPRILSETLLPVFEKLVERKRRDFQEDWRLMSGLQVRWSWEGEPHIRLQAHLPDAARPAR